MASTDLVPVVHPVTGEVIALHDATTDALAHERREGVEMKRSIGQYLDEVDAELVRRLDRMGRRSATVGGWSIETKAPTTTTYDEARLLQTLRDLIEDDALDPAVVDEVLVPVDPVPRKLNRARLNTLLKHPDAQVRDALEACGSEVEQKRSVSVKEPRP